LFSGIGGLDLAAEWAGFRTVAFVERDKYCQRVLAKHWPGVPIFGDVCEVVVNPTSAQREEVRGRDERTGRPAERLGLGCGGIAILSGGFPCQPHSVAGKRKASLDERDLWGECARIAGEFKPRWCVFENVPGLLSSEGGTFFARVVGDLAALGYRVGWGVWGANDVGALHRRDRVFIVGRLADANSERLQERQMYAGIPPKTGRHDYGENSPLDGWWDVEPPVGRVASRVPRRVDRLRALGNAVVPQQAYPIFKAIAEIEGIA
jgi:DNA (cytosine-5)-methyltransferase 1